jgi:hypothetical protein
LGHESIAATRAKISARELILWQIVDAISPFEDVRGDLRAMAIANAIRVALGQRAWPESRFMIVGNPPSQRRKTKGTPPKPNLAGGLAGLLGVKTVPRGK